MQDAINTQPGEATLRRHINPVPRQGEDGLYYQTWYPICLSSDVAKGQVVGHEFLGGRVIVVRGESGTVRVQSAYCPHLGADLSAGRVVGDHVQCAFHKWEYDHRGRCVRTAVGDPAPPTACIFNFPTVEKFGVVWAFNGESADWELPSFDIPEERLLIRAYVTKVYHCDGWVFAANTPDMQHFKAVHGVKFKHADPHNAVDWVEHGFNYSIAADHQNDIPIEWRVGIRGASFYWQHGTYNGWWIGGTTGFSCPGPGRHQAFASLAIEKGDGSEEALAAVEQRLQVAEALMWRTLEEDRPVLDTIHYAPGTLTKGDTTLARYLNFLRKMPRAHPSAPFIR